nr:GH-E family nuclease [Halogeometricum borinquense]
MWKQAKEKGLDEKVRDPNTTEILEWDRDKPRRGQWDMGHEPGEEYWRKHIWMV